MKDFTHYKNFEEDTWQRQVYDLSFLSLKDYLLKYHRNFSGNERTEWQNWLNKYIEPAFNEARHDEMIKNFGYVSIDKHDFKKQYSFYDELQKDQRLDEEARKFIGFMAGNHFFDKHVTSITEWFDSTYWTRPDLKGNYPDYEDNNTINEVLNLPYGLNYFKSVLLGLNHWRR